MDRHIMMLAALIAVASCIPPAVQAEPSTETFRLYHGITAYVDNPRGKDFTLTLDVRDLNLVANGPREVLLKIYNPDGQAVVREIIPDDGITSKGYMPRMGGWDHELDYYALCYSRGTMPMIRWSTPSEPKRLEALAKRTFTHSVKGGLKGIYRIVVVGERDHYVTMKLEPDLPYGVCGHHTWLHGQGGKWQKSYIYVPKGTVGLHLAFAEPDIPRSRRFTLTGRKGRKLFDGPATGSFLETQVKFEKDGEYDDELLTLGVSDGPGDYLVHVTLQREVKDYVGMGVPAIMARDKKTARALNGGAIYEDGEVFWHPFQLRLHRYLGAHKLKDPALDAQVRELAFPMMALIGPSDGRGSKTWTNWGYAFGYYGCKIWRSGWLLMKRQDVPQELKELIRECFLVGGDRLSFAIGMERVNGNAFAQIPVGLWYCHQATGDPLQRERFETYFERWRTEAWGDGSGISKSGDSQEHFAHDMHYGSYIMDNWLGGTWVKPGILDDSPDPRFRETFERIADLYSYLHCPDAAANPWSSRTAQGAHGATGNWARDGRTWKGEPGPDFTVSVNGGDEWFATRRKNYYLLTFHGRLAPEWMSNTFYGQLGFGGGIICQLTVPGKGTVLASTLHGSYGTGMHLANWRNFHIHSVVGEMWNGEPFVADVSEHDDARLESNTVTSSGEVRGRPVRASRKYTFEVDAVACEVSLAATDYQKILTLWSGDRKLTELREAYEMIPFLPTGWATLKDKEGRERKQRAKTKVTAMGDEGKEVHELGEEPFDAKSIDINCGEYGVRVELPSLMKVHRGANNTVLVHLADGLTKAENISLRYRLVPYLKQ